MSKLDIDVCLRKEKWGNRILKAPAKHMNDNELTLSDKLELARQALHDFHVQCFWYLREDMELKPSDLDEIIRGLRHNGGRRGFLLAERLCR